ncbi:MAG: UDP-N-acetylmuramoyl-tripeptide--D-alanyl-D-alanine ligase, partial [Verrucomicrobia bacterium]|nr:UDP-N-acetylmuramoyl-tripeptide--D-alanyl-D-alanine ligase [Verrucomicrobiota bacterium]
MNPLSILEIAKLAEAKFEQGDGETSIERISTDSRTIKKGELFVALRGENFDGHRFVSDVAKNGAAGAIVDLNWQGKVPNKFGILRANDSLLAYQNLAKNYRNSLSLKVVAITGSNGKTSTKDFCASVLGRKFCVTKTQGNFNNHVGLPRTILEAASEHQVGVWEIGMNHPGEVAPLAKIAAPDTAIITNIGVAHIEFMGTREAIAREKGTLAETVGSEGTVILNADDPFSEGIAKRTRARIVFAGVNNGVLRAADIEQGASGSEFTILEGAHRCRAQLSVPGLHMVQNALLAVAAGRAFGVSLEECAIGLATAPLTKARLQIREVHGVRFLDDSYNANPDSMKAALRTLVELDAEGKRIAVLGEMRELGSESQRGHEEVGQEAAALGVDRLIGIGEMGGVISGAAKKAGLEKSHNLGSTSEAADLLTEIAEPGDLVLIKGSRLARTEEVIAAFAKQTENVRV